MIRGAVYPVKLGEAEGGGRKLPDVSEIWGQDCDMGDDRELGDRLAVKFRLLLAHLDERARRLYLGSEALALEGEPGAGRGGGAAEVSRATVGAGADGLATSAPSASPSPPPAQTRHRTTRPHQK
jgi:hypothetical protein